MSQSRKHSVFETVANVTIGYIVAMVAQVAILPMFGVVISIGDNLTMGLMFTGISVVRSYALRRLFNAWHARRA